MDFANGWLRYVDCQLFFKVKILRATRSHHVARKLCHDALPKEYFEKYSSSSGPRATPSRSKISSNSLSPSSPLRRSQNSSATFNTSLRSHMPFIAQRTEESATLFCTVIQKPLFRPTNSGHFRRRVKIPNQLMPCLDHFAWHFTETKCITEAVRYN